MTMKSRERQQILAQNQDGFALILVLLVVGALSALILDMNYTTRVNFRLAENFRDETQAVFLALGSVEAAKALLLEDGNFAYDARVGEDDAIWATSNEHMEEGGSIKIKFTILDEGGKLYIDDYFPVTPPPKTTAKQTAFNTVLNNLEQQLDLEPDIFDAIQDWIDSDTIPLTYGAENDDYYHTLDQPYDATNAKLLDLSELLLVKGINDELYLGINSGFPVGLNDIFTLYKNGRTGTINVNTAHREVLTALVNDQFASDVADAIPIEKKTVITQFSGYSSAAQTIKNMLDVTSSHFSVYVWIQVHNVTKRFHSVLQRDHGNGKVTVQHWQEL